MSYAKEWGEVYNKAVRALGNSKGQRPGAQDSAETRHKLMSLIDDVIKGTSGLVKSLDRLDKLDADVRITTEKVKAGEKAPILIDHESDPDDKKAPGTINSVKEVEKNLVVPLFAKSKQVVGEFGKELKILHGEAAKYKILLDKAVTATDKAKYSDAYRELKVMSTQLQKILAEADERAKAGGQELLKAEQKLDAAMAAAKKRAIELQKEEENLRKRLFDKVTGGTTTRKAGGEGKDEKVVTKIKPTDPRLDARIAKARKEFAPQKAKLDEKKSALAASRILVELRERLGANFASKAKTATARAAAVVQAIRANPTGETYNDKFADQTYDFLELASHIITTLSNAGCPKDFANQIGGLRAQNAAIKKFSGSAKTIADDATKQTVDEEMKEFSRLVKEAAPYFEKVDKYLAKNKL